jgi:hypothetical protein
VSRFPVRGVGRFSLGPPPIDIDESSKFIEARGASRYEAFWIAGAFLAFLAAWYLRWSAVLALNQEMPDRPESEAWTYLSIFCTLIGIGLAWRYVPEAPVWVPGIIFGSIGAALGVVEADKYEFGYRYLPWPELPRMWSLVWAVFLAGVLMAVPGPQRPRAAEKVVEAYLNTALALFLMIPVVVLFAFLSSFVVDSFLGFFTLAGFVSCVLLLIGLIWLYRLVNRRWGRRGLEAWGLAVFLFLVLKELAFCIYWLMNMSRLTEEAAKASYTPGLSGLAVVVALVLAAGLASLRSSSSSGPRSRSP